jgi:hypothetical protein
VLAQWRSHASRVHSIGILIAAGTALPSFALQL